MVNLNCRFYKNKFPEENDVVVVCIKSIAEMGAYVDLLEYNNIEGMILLSELSRRRIRSINKLVRVGKNECVVVIRVDKEKGYIDLSKRRVSPEEVKKCEDKYTRSRTVASIVRHAAELAGYTTNEELEQLMDSTAWYFDEKYKSTGGSYEIFRHVLNDPSVLDECNLDKKIIECLISCIRHRMEPKRMKARADIEVSCYKYDGIDAVKTALKCGLNFATENFPIKINLIAPPVYVIMVSILDKVEGLALLNSVIESIKESILKAHGNFSIKLEPKIVTESDETDLVKQLQNLEQANTEVDGDDDYSDSGSSSDDNKKN